MRRKNWTVARRETVHAGGEGVWNTMTAGFYFCSPMPTTLTSYLVIPFDAVHALENPTQGNMIRVGAGLVAGGAFVAWGSKIDDAS